MTDRHEIVLRRWKLAGLLAYGVIALLAMTTAFGHWEIFGCSVGESAGSCAREWFAMLGPWVALAAAIVTVRSMDNQISEMRRQGDILQIPLLMKNLREMERDRDNVRTIKSSMNSTYDRMKRLEILCGKENFEVDINTITSDRKLMKYIISMHNATDGMNVIPMGKARRKDMRDLIKSCRVFRIMYSARDIDENKRVQVIVKKLQTIDKIFDAAEIIRRAPTIVSLADRILEAAKVASEEVEGVLERAVHRSNLL